MQSFRRFLPVVFVLAACAHASAAESASTLLERLGDKKTTSAERTKARLALIALGDEAVEPIVELYGNRRTSDSIRAVLIDTLGGIRSGASVKALRGIAAAAMLLPMDVTDWPGLVEALAAAATGGTGSPVGRISMLMPNRTRELIAGADAAEAEDTRFRAQVVGGLNQVMEAWNLYEPSTFAGVSLPRETAEYISRWKPKRPKDLIPSVDISPFELQRLNRLLMQAGLSTYIAEPPPFDIITYRGHLAGRALKALTSINTADAVEIVVSVRPHTGKVEHVDALSAIPDDRALDQLLAYLVSDELAASTRARAGLAARFAANRSGADTALKMVIARISTRGVTFAPHVAENVAALCATLNERDAARLLADCVESRSDIVAAAGLDALAGRLDLVPRSEIISALYDLTGRSLSAELALKALTVLRDGKARQGVDIAAAMLDHESPRVQSMAASTLRALTGKTLGAPQEWRTAMRSKPTFLLPDDEQPGTRATSPVTATPGGDRTSYAVYYYIILGSLLVAVLVVGATKRRRAIADKHVDKSRRKRAREENFISLD
jgi:hypothetical protein